MFYKRIFIFLLKAIIDMLMVVPSRRVNLIIPRKILYICLAERGDIIISSSAISRIKKNFPESEITYICNIDYLDVAELLPDLSRIIGVRVKEGIIENILYFYRVCREITYADYDVVFDESGVYLSFLIWYPSKARQVFVIDQHGVGQFATAFLVYDEKTNLISRRKILTDFICSDDEVFKPFISSEYLNETTIAYLLPPTYITLQLIGGWRGKSIDPDVAFNLIEFINKKYFLPVVVLGAKADFGDPYKKLEKLDALNFCGRLTIRESSYVVSKSLMHIGADSFLRHVATAVNTPSITIYGSTSHLLSGYLDNCHIPVFSDISCRPIGSQYCALDAGRSCSNLMCMKELPKRHLEDVTRSHLDAIIGNLKQSEKIF